MLWETERGNAHPLGTRSNSALFLHHASKDLTVLASWAGFKWQTQRRKAPGLEHCTEESRSDSQASTLWQQEVTGRSRAQQTEEFYPETKQGVSHGQRSSTLLFQHFKCISVSSISRGKISKYSTRRSLAITPLSVRADASTVDDYSGCTGDLKRQHLVTTA